MFNFLIGVIIGVLIGSLIGLALCWKYNDDWYKDSLKLNKEWFDYSINLIEKFYGKDTETSEEKSCTDCKWYGTFTCECWTSCTSDTKIAWEAKGDSE